MFVDSKILDVVHLLHSPQFTSSVNQNSSIHELIDQHKRWLQLFSVQRLSSSHPCFTKPTANDEKEEMCTRHVGMESQAGASQAADSAEVYSGTAACLALLEPTVFCQSSGSFSGYRLREHSA